MTSSPTPIHLVTSPARFTWESDGGGAGCGSEAVESDGEDDNDEDDENGFGGGDDEDGDDDDDEDDGGDNGCCSFCSEMGRFSWLIGGKMEQSSWVGESLITTMDHSFNWIFFKDWICSHSLGSSRTKTRSSSTIFFFSLSLFNSLPPNYEGGGGVRKCDIPKHKTLSNTIFVTFYQRHFQLKLFYLTKIHRSLLILFCF